MSTNKITSSPDSIPVSMCVEHDDKIRTCRITLYTRPVVSQVQNNTNNKRSQASNKNGIGPIAFHHWALVFSFDYGDVTWTLDAGKNEDGILEAYRTPGALRDPTHTFEIGTANTSPMELLELAKIHPHNGKKYWAIYENCQEWVKEYARMLDKKLLEKIEDLSTCKQAAVTTGVAMGAAAVVGLLAASAYKWFSDKNEPNSENVHKNKTSNDDSSD